MEIVVESNSWVLCRGFMFTAHVGNVGKADVICRRCFYSQPVQPLFGGWGNFSNASSGKVALAPCK